MPLYEFRCRSCGKKFELLCPAGFNGDRAGCPVCGFEGADRLLSTFNARSASGSGGGGDEAGSGFTRIGPGGCASCAGTSCATCGG